MPHIEWHFCALQLKLYRNKNNFNTVIGNIISQFASRDFSPLSSCFFLPPRIPAKARQNEKFKNTFDWAIIYWYVQALNTILHGTYNFTKLFHICFVHLNDTAKLASAVKNFYCFIKYLNNPVTFVQHIQIINLVIRNNQYGFNSIW